MIVIALGGNALLKKNDKPSVSLQMNNVKKAVKNILPILKKNQTVITFGNGPQVGNIMIQVEEALGKAYPIPLYVAVAESQGEIGYMIEEQIINSNIKKPVVSILTQVLVDRKDKAFKNPTKPIGPFYNKKQAKILSRKGIIIEKMIGGYRRVVPSPKPIKIIEATIIKKLAKTSVVIAVGGGGIPVYKSGKNLKGIDAVIDKDRASACLANSIGANTLIILTDVDKVYLNYGEKNQKELNKLTINDAKKYLKENQFSSGSMGPKIESAINFIKKGGKKVIITSPGKIQLALKEKSGTIIKR